MSATRPEDVAAMFDLPPPAAAPSNAEAVDVAAAEAELAAELAAAIEAGDIAADAPDSRAKLRVEVAWPARMRLPGGQVIALTVRNVSEDGVGLMSDEPLPASTVVDFEMDVPPLDAGGGATTVKGRIKTAYTIVHGSERLCGGTWQAPPAGLEFVSAWIDVSGR